MAKGHLLAIHIKDSLPQVIRGVPFETGIVPLSETFQALAQIGFWGPMGVEMWADMDVDCNPMASAMAARDLVKRLATAAWPEYCQPGDCSTG